MRQVGALVLLSLGLGWMLLNSAGVATRDASVALVLIGVAACLAGSMPGRGERRREWTDPVMWMAMALLVVVALQVAPLPMGGVGVVSPRRAELVEWLTPVLGGVGWAPLSNQVSATWQRGLQLLGCVLTMLVVRWAVRWMMRRGGGVWWAVAPMIAVATAEAVLGLIQYGMGEGATIATGTYANRNHLAGLMEMSLPFVVVMAVWILRHGGGASEAREMPAGSAVLACLLLGLAVLMLAATLFSLSRMGFLAAIAALLMTGLPGWWSWLTGWRWRVALMSAAVLAGAIGFVFLPTDQLIARFANIAATEDISTDDRARIWQDTRRMIGDYAVTGCGLGAYEPSFVRYQTVAPMQTVNFAHNDYLQVLAETGAAGFALVLAMGIWVSLGAVRTAAEAENSQARYVALACCGSLTAIWLHSLVDFNLYVPANSMVAAWVLGLAEGVRRRPERVGSREGRW